MRREALTFTPMQLIGGFLAICAGISCIAGAVGVIINMISKAKAPNIKQDERLDKLEKLVSKHEELLSNDKKRFESIEEGNRVTQKAMLALLAHGIDGNEIESMRSAKKELENYLISR